MQKSLVVVAQGKVLFWWQQQKLDLGLQRALKGRTVHVNPQIPRVLFLDIFNKVPEVAHGLQQFHSLIAK